VYEKENYDARRYSIATISARQMSDCSAMMNNGVKTRESQLYRNLRFAITTFKTEEQFQSLIITRC